MVLSIISNIVIYGTILAVFLRVLSRCGIALPSGTVSRAVLADKSRGASDEVGARELMIIFAACVAFRLVIYIISAVPISLFTSEESLSFSSWLSQWRQWDANGYNHMIAGGYDEMVENGTYVTLVFFPLFTFIASIFDTFIKNTEISALLTSTLCYAGACCFLYKLAALDFGRSAAKKALLYISVFPFGFFFGAMLTESTFLLTSAATLYYIRKHNWLMAGVLGALAALSRLAGIMLIFPAAVEFIEHYRIFGLFKEKKAGQAMSLIAKKGSLLLIAFVGILIYLWCNYSVTGDWFYFMDLHKTVWTQETCYFGECIRIIWDTMLSDRTLMVKAAIFVPEVILIIIMLVFMVYGIRRTRSMYTTYFVVYFVVNLCATWIISFGRYSLCAIPMFLCMAEFSDRHESAHAPITAISAILFGIYLTGYLFGKQIM